jgi:uncharacterized membrane protein YeaQ/YmgE (transglycosylase-associated protein family)
MSLGDALGKIISAPFICAGWIIVGAVAGALARRIMGAKDRPLINDLVLGLIGAVVGGIVAGWVGFGSPDGGLTRVIFSLITATAGAALLIYAGQLIRGRR